MGEGLGPCGVLLGPVPGGVQVSAGGYMLVRSDRRTLGISVARDGAVIVRAPRRAPAGMVAAAVARRAEWIAWQQARFAALGPPASPPTWVEGEAHRHLGRDYRLAVERGLRQGVRLDADLLMLTMHRPERVTARAALVDRWRREAARSVCEEAIGRLMPAFAARGHARPTLTIRVLKRRWGSMSRNGAMTLSRDLVRAPFSAIEFVVAHELCHLVHFHHGPAFHALLAEIMPDHRARRTELERALA